MKEKEVKDLIDRSIGTKGPLNVPAFWMNKLLKDMVDLSQGNSSEAGLASLMTEVTYAELVELRDGKKLIPGHMYRMTDYETTAYGDDTWYNVICAGHPFDLILTALDTNVLDENCSAIWSKRDTKGYFANNNLPAWEIKYSLDNNPEVFYGWETTKGYIYKLTDDGLNTLPYDFKNIMFSRPLTEGMYDSENGVDTWCYTFSVINEKTYDIEDASIIYPVHNCVTYNNKFEDFCLDNVFIIYDSWGDVYDNKFGGTCTGNTFIGYTEANIFEHYCSENIFRNNCYYNVFGTNCTYITANGEYYDNTFSSDCYGITFDGYSESNIFEAYCSNITLGDYAQCNTFKQACNNITLGDYAQYNTFNAYCSNISFYNTETASDDNAIQNYHVSCVTNNNIHVRRNRNYDTYVTTKSDGTIVEYTVDNIDAQNNERPY